MLIQSYSNRRNTLIGLIIHWNILLYLRSHGIVSTSWFTQVQRRFSLPTCKWIQHDVCKGMIFRRNRKIFKWEFIMGWHVLNKYSSLHTAFTARKRPVQEQNLGTRQKSLEWNISNHLGRATICCTLGWNVPNNYFSFDQRYLGIQTIQQPNSRHNVGYEATKFYRNWWDDGIWPWKVL